VSDLFVSITRGIGIVAKSRYWLSRVTIFLIYIQYPACVKCIGLVARKIESAYIQTSGLTRNWSTAGAVHRMRRWIPFVHLRLDCIGDARTKKSKTANNNEHEGLECVRDRELAKELVFDSDAQDYFGAIAKPRAKSQTRPPRAFVNGTASRVRRFALLRLERKSLPIWQSYAENSCGD